MIHIMQLLILLFLLPSLVFFSSSLYKKVPVSHYTVQSSRPQAKTLIHCGGICRSKLFCTGFAYDEICKLVTQASLIGKSEDMNESDLSLERIYIDTSIVETKGKYRIVPSSKAHYRLGNQLFVKRSQYIRIENPLHKK